MSTSHRPEAVAAARRRGPLGFAGRTTTFSSLADPNFRLLWVSMLFSFTAIQMTITAQGFLTHELADAAIALGIVALGWGIPQLSLTLVGGVAADRLHKRWLIVISQATLAVTSGLTAVLIQTGVIEVWHIFVMALITGAVFAFNVPARQAWIPEMVGDERLMNAVALNTAAFTSTGVIGPGLAGALIAVPFIGLTGVYYLMAGCFAVASLLVFRLPGGAPNHDRQATPPLQDLTDGVRYVRRHSLLPILILMGFVAIVIGMPYRTFFPIFADDVYHVGSVGLGAMGVAMSVGALLGSLAVASLSNTSRRSLIQLVGGIGFGATLILFAAAANLWLALGALFLVGLASNGYWALNNTMVLAAADRAYTGRVMSVYMLSWSVMPFVALPQSVLADAVGVQTMVAGVGVVLIVIIAAIAMLLPGHRRLRERDEAAAEAAPAS